MRYLVLLILALGMLLPMTVQAYDVLVLQSKHDPACDELLKGFTAEHPGSQRVIFMSDYAEIDAVRIVREERPALIVAIGDAAMKEARKVQSIPVIALMTLGIEMQAAIQHNLTGVSMLPEPEKYLALFKAMNTGRVGLVYNPARNGRYVEQAQRTAREMGIELVVGEASTPSAALAKLGTLVGKVDAFWMLPDPTIISRDTVKTWFRVAQEKSIPVVSFSAAYLAKGATALIDIDRYQSGREAGKIANRAIQGEIPPVHPAKCMIRVSPVMVERYLIPFPLEIKPD